MKAQRNPYQQMIFVCTNAREPGARISCAGQGRCGERILEQLKTYVKSNKLEDRVRVAKSGCQEKCEIGPTISLLPQNKMLTDVSEKDIEEIIRVYLAPLHH